MAGHSHAHNVAIRKGKQDKKRAIEFSKASKEIMVAARGGADPTTNFQLRHTIQKARAISVPKDKIEHAIKKGAGLLEGGTELQPVTYEGYGSGGIALLVECLTDNLNRTASMVRSVFDKAGGNISTPGSVSYMFKRKGLFIFDGLGKSKDELEELLILEKEFDVTVDEVEEGKFEVLCPFEEFQNITEYLEKEFELEVSELAMIPDTLTAIDDSKAQKVVKLIQNLEDLEDCTNVYSSIDLSGNNID